MLIHTTQLHEIILFEVYLISNNLVIDNVFFFPFNLKL